MIYRFIVHFVVSRLMTRLAKANQKRLVEYAAKRLRADAEKRRKAMDELEAVIAKLTIEVNESKKRAGL